MVTSEPTRAAQVVARNPAMRHIKMACLYNAERSMVRGVRYGLPRAQDWPETRTRVSVSNRAEGNAGLLAIVLRDSGSVDEANSPTRP